MEKERLRHVRDPSETPALWMGQKRMDSAGNRQGYGERNPGQLESRDDILRNARQCAVDVIQELASSTDSCLKRAILDPVIGSLQECLRGINIQYHLPATAGEFIS